MATYALSNFRALQPQNAEALKALRFSDEEVLNRPEDIRVRRTNLDKALSLARSENYTTALVMVAGEELVRTDSTVTAVADGFVYTGSGLKIPMGCILSVDFFSK